MNYKISSIILAIVILCGLSASSVSALTETEQTRLTAIVSKGDQEIERRVKALTAAEKLIDETKKLSATDKQTLKEEVSTTSSSLTALKVKLDADTVLADARTDAKSIVSEYRVFALVLPKVHLIKVADGQAVLEGQFSTLSTQFLQRFAELKTAGKDTSALETTLADMNTKVSDAQAISSAIQAKVITLQPTDYNADLTILSGDRDQLKLAHDKLASAQVDAKTIVAGIASFNKK